MSDYRILSYLKLRCLGLSNIILKRAGLKLCGCHTRMTSEQLSSNLRHLRQDLKIFDFKWIDYMISQNWSTKYCKKIQIDLKNFHRGLPGFFLVFNCVRSQQHLIWETFPRKKKPFMTSCFLLSIDGARRGMSLSGTNWTRLISFCSVPSVIDIKPYRDYSMYSSRQMEWTHITLHNMCSGLTNGMQFDTLLAMAAA